MPIIFDFHAEATSEKQCFGHFVDGRASFVVGTHTHVPTADHQILNGGTAYMSDAGMCGDYDSSLGMEKEEPLNRFISKMPRAASRPPSGPATICGVGVEISDAPDLRRRSRRCGSARVWRRRSRSSGPDGADRRGFSRLRLDESSVSPYKAAIPNNKT